MSDFTEDEPTTLEQCRPGLFMLRGVLWTKIDAPVDEHFGAPVLSADGTHSFLAPQITVVPVTQVVVPQDRLAVAWVADLITKNLANGHAEVLDIIQPETVADAVLRGIGLPDDWTEPQLRYWVKFMMDVSASEVAATSLHPKPPTPPAPGGIR